LHDVVILRIGVPIPRLRKAGLYSGAAIAVPADTVPDLRKALGQVARSKK
jgi:hypothetical protein